MNSVVKVSKNKSKKNSLGYKIKYNLHKGTDKQNSMNKYEGTSKGLHIISATFINNLFACEISITIPNLALFCSNFIKLFFLILQLEYSTYLYI